MSTAIRVVDCTDSAFETLAGSFAARDDDPITGRFGRRYYPATNPEAVDRSFIVVGAEGPIVLVHCTALGEVLGWHGFPIRPVVNDLRVFDASDVGKALIDALGQRVPKMIDGCALFESPIAGGNCLSAFERMALLSGGKCTTRIIALVDLSVDASVIEGSLRKSYRSLVNRGRRELTMHRVDHASPDRSQFDRFRHLHKVVAGRTTRQDASWDSMFCAIMAGEGVLHLAEDKSGRAVGGIYVALGTSRAYYASSAFLRDPLDRANSHWPQLASILDAQSRGVGVYELGQIPFEGDVDRKNSLIGFYKSGFTDTLVAHRIWKLTSKGEAQ